MSEKELVREVATRLGLYHMLGSSDGDDELYDLILRRIDFYMKGHASQQRSLSRIFSFMDLEKGDKSC